MHEQDITRRQPGHHLSQMERGRIAELYATGTSKREIAAKIGVCHQTINNEIDRGTVKQAKRINGKLIYHTEYSPEAAQTRYETARLNCHRPINSPLQATSWPGMLIRPRLNTGRLMQPLAPHGEPSYSPLRRWCAQPLYIATSMINA